MASESLLDRKRELRRITQARRRAIAEVDARQAAEAVAHHVSQLPEFAAARYVALYVPRPGSGELETKPIFESVQAAGKRGVLPRCLESGTLEYAPVEHWDSLRPGRYGIPEPTGQSVSLVGSDVVVVCPGVAFDGGGGRLGMGGGYVDRTFSSFPGGRPFLVGIGYECQIVDDLPMEEHDQLMDAVVTESGPLTLRKEKRRHG